MNISLYNMFPDNSVLLSIKLTKKQKNDWKINFAYINSIDDSTFLSTRGNETANFILVVIHTKNWDFKSHHDLKVMISYAAL